MQEARNRALTLARSVLKAVPKVPPTHTHTHTHTPHRFIRGGGEVSHTGAIVPHPQMNEDFECTYSRSEVAAVVRREIEKSAHIKDVKTLDVLLFRGRQVRATAALCSLCSDHD